MFYYAGAFNQDIGGWAVENVTDMSHTFCMASAFDQPLNDWRVDKVTDMSGMFDTLGAVLRSGHLAVGRSTASRT